MITFTSQKIEEPFRIRPSNSRILNLVELFEKGIGFLVHIAVSTSSLGFYEEV